MAEEVSTGGLVTFRYEKGEQPALGEEQKKEIRDAYAVADERKARERRNEIILWIIGAVLLAGLLGFVIFRSL